MNSAQNTVTLKVIFLLHSWTPVIRLIKQWILGYFMQKYKILWFRHFARHFNFTVTGNHAKLHSIKCLTNEKISYKHSFQFHLLSSSLIELDLFFWIKEMAKSECHLAQVISQLEHTKELIATIKFYLSASFIQTIYTEPIMYHFTKNLPMHIPRILNITSTSDNKKISWRYQINVILIEKSDDFVFIRENWMILRLSISFYLLNFFIFVKKHFWKFFEFARNFFYTK